MYSEVIHTKINGGIKMQTPICPTCGCSLVRLGITKENAVIRKHRGMEYSFCCDGCATAFQENAEALLEETSGLVVCPSCLAEKSVNQTVVLNFRDEKLYFCRCPHCITVFQEDPEYYIKRLVSDIEFDGIFSKGLGCCS